MKMISGIWQKLGFWPKELINKWKNKSNWIWFHAVSVGELKAVWPLILTIQNAKPYPIMLSCTTKAGYNLAQDLTKDKNILVFYFPFDFPSIIRSLLKYANIKLLIIVETEIWPTLLNECVKRKIPIVLVNARLSDNSFKNYLFLKFYFKNIVNLFSKVLAQSERDADKFIKLGLATSKILTLGNIKYSSLKPFENFANGIGIDIGKKVLVDNELTTKILFASTHPNEEEIAIKVFKNLLKSFNNIRLLIAPRHTNRTNDIIKLVKHYGFNPVLRSSNNILKSQNDIFILDTIGELVNYYKISQITVLGGSFVKVGGHNILEPICCGSYTIIGPYDYKITEITKLFKDKNAIRQVSNPDELTIRIKEALLSENIRNSTISNGQKIIEQHGSILEQTAEQVFSYL